MSELGYLIDTSGFVQLMRDPKTLDQWRSPLESGLIRIAKVTRAEVLYSATGPAHRDELEADLNSLFGPALALPKGGEDWAHNAQYKLTQKGRHRSAGAVDLLLCSVAVHHNYPVLHVDNDFAAVSRVVTEFRERDIREARSGSCPG
ncbi:PIN domain-containing protein [Kitasatospora sp. NPDC057500]|uniref:PIN domain-containing protein n=1 Tax=Kitasatospora sp. NPDC057500 TaxID=3346151 RepID=UPI00369BAA51